MWALKVRLFPVVLLQETFFLNSSALWSVSRALSLNVSFVIQLYYINTFQSFAIDLSHCLCSSVLHSRITNDFGDIESNAFLIVILMCVDLI